MAQTVRGLGPNGNVSLPGVRSNGCVAEASDRVVGWRPWRRLGCAGGVLIKVRMAVYEQQSIADCGLVRRLLRPWDCRGGPVLVRCAHPSTDGPAFRSLSGEAEIVAFADELGVAPGIVVGRMQFLGVVPWKTPLTRRGSRQR